MTPELPYAEEEYIKMLQLSDYGLTQEIELAFEGLTIDDISAVAQDFAALLFDCPEETMLTNRLSLLGSSKFQQLVSPLIGDDLSQYARMLMAISIVFRKGSQVSQYLGHSIEELQRLQSFAGTRALQELETALKNPFDKHLSSSKGQALFLTLFSIIAAVANYCPQPSHSQLVITPILYNRGPC